MRENSILDFAVLTVVNGQLSGFLRQVDLPSLSLVFTNDPRLSDARAPLVHGAGAHDATVEAKANKNLPNGYPGLDGGARIGVDRLPLVAVVTTDARLTDSRAPTGPASGDLAGSYPSPTVAGLQGTVLPVMMPNGFIRRDASNLAWQATDDVAADTDLDETVDTVRQLQGVVMDNQETLEAEEVSEEWAEQLEEAGVEMEN